jgi:hypothetical protein
LPAWAAGHVPSLRLQWADLNERVKGGGKEARRLLLRWRALRQYYFAGGTIFITKPVGFSVAPNGPGTLFVTAGMLLR